MKSKLFIAASLTTVVIYRTVSCWAEMAEAPRFDNSLKRRYW